nr:hypothetical protein [Candidatus Freyarchaeota archaeon]
MVKELLIRGKTLEEIYGKNISEEEWFPLFESPSRFVIGGMDSERIT